MTKKKTLSEFDAFCETITENATAGTLEHYLYEMACAAGYVNSPDAFYGNAWGIKKLFDRLTNKEADANS